MCLVLGVTLQAHGDEIRCVNQNSEWCNILDSSDISDGSNIAIGNADHGERVTHFGWRDANNVKTIPRIIFEKFPRLEILDLQVGLESLSPSDFDLAVNLSTLALMKNKISNLPTGVFAKASNIETLQFEANTIANIEDYAFKGLDKLYLISLHYNCLTAVGRFTFAGAKNLNELDLDNNDIRTIEAGAFDLPKLATLSLIGNLLTTLPNGLFDQAPLLTSLDISDNSFSTVPEVLIGHNSIETLDLTWNPLQEIRLADFAKLPKLQTLTLQQCSVIWPTLTEDWNEPSTSPVTELNLAITNLNNSDVLKLVSVFKSLEKLKLNGNNITTINNIVDVKERFPNITEISLEDNSVDCKWLKGNAEFLKGVEVEVLVGDTCDEE